MVTESSAGYSAILPRVPARFRPNNGSVTIVTGARHRLTFSRSRAVKSHVYGGTDRTAGELPRYAGTFRVTRTNL